MNYTIGIYSDYSNGRGRWAVYCKSTLRQDRWQQDGQPRSKVTIAANNVQLLGGNDAKGQPRQQSEYQAQEYSADNFVSEASTIPF